MAVNHLADKTELELKALRGRKYSGVYNGGAPFPYNHIDRAQLPTDFDWRIYGAVTPVKGKCNYYAISFSTLIGVFTNFRLTRINN